MTICPNRVKSPGVSITISPVTQVAEVAVNRALTGEMPLTVDTGRSSKTVPTMMRLRKLKAMIWVGCSLLVRLGIFSFLRLADFRACLMGADKGVR